MSQEQSPAIGKAPVETSTQAKTSYGYKDEGNLDDEAATHLYDELKMILQAKPYASIPAIKNVYEISIEQDKEAEKTDPMALWDFHYLRRIDDSGFIDNLYRT